MNSYHNGSYMNYYYGTEAPQLAPEVWEDPFEKRRQEEAVRRERQRRAQAQRQERKRARRLNVAMLVFTIGVVAVVSLFLLYYLNLQTKVTNAVQNIATLQSEYADLRQSNDEALNQLNSSINLDEIKYKAMTELGMTYPQEDQMITYSNEDNDYVHQVQEIQK